ncbi:Translin [Pisolithus sp. B1]|nr:Translin [Pisolithus sp. B1]
MVTDVRVVQDMFDEFKKEFDAQNDRREFLVKASRDITGLSKKVIFLLHRIMNEDAQDASAQSKRASESGMAKLREVQAVYAKIKVELQGDLFWRHHRAISPSLQEYVEATSFAWYLGHSTLVSFNQVQQELSDENGVPVCVRLNAVNMPSLLQFFPLPLEDYLCGLSDLTGELMRLAISGIARKGGRDRARKICVIVRKCKTELEKCAPHVKEVRKKQAVATESLAKIEDAVYATVIRTSEYDLSDEILDCIISRSVSTGHGGNIQGSGRHFCSGNAHEDD